MKALLGFLRATLVGGILFLVPVIVLAVVLGKALAFANNFVEPMAEQLPVHSVIGLRAPVFLALLLVVVICFAAGLLARTALARRAHDQLEKSVLSNVPGYSVMKLMGAGMLGASPDDVRPVVLVRTGDAWQIGFLVERLGEGFVAVHIPEAISPQSGSIFVLPENRVKVTKIPPGAALKSLRGFGLGSAALLRDHVAGLKETGESERTPSS